jgi:thioredoxin 1
MSESLNATNFDQVIRQSEKPVVVDFWAPWCGPCKVMSPIVDQVAQETPGMVVAKVNVDEEGPIAQRYNILSIPTFVVFKGGNVVEQFSGSMTKDAFKEKISKHL